MGKRTHIFQIKNQIKIGRSFEKEIKWKVRVSFENLLLCEHTIANVVTKKPKKPKNYYKKKWDHYFQTPQIKVGQLKDEEVNFI